MIFIKYLDYVITILLLIRLIEGFEKIFLYLGNVRKNASSGTLGTRCACIFSFSLRLFVLSGEVQTQFVHHVGKGTDKTHIGDTLKGVATKNHA